MAQMGERLGDAEPDQAVVELMRATQALPDYAPAWVELLHAFIRLRGQQPGMAITTDDLRRLEMPLLYVWGPRDPFGAQDVGRRAAAIASEAELAEVPHGHIPWLSDPDAVAAPVRRFLAAVGWEHTAGRDAGAPGCGRHI